MYVDRLMTNGGEDARLFSAIRKRFQATFLTRRYARSNQSITRSVNPRDERHIAVESAEDLLAMFSGLMHHAREGRKDAILER
jgi:hypothetical protein